MKVVLLGPDGQLGSDIAAVNDRLGQPLTIVPVNRAQLDLSDISLAVSKLSEQTFDCLINCSSYHKTDEVETNAQTAFNINAHLTAKLATVCRNKHARFVHISTDYVFGGQLKRVPLTEEDARAPLNVYGASKSMGEDLARMNWDDVIILRVASLFGIAGASGKGGNFVESMIRLGREKGSLRVVNDQVMSPSSTADVATALIHLLIQEAPAGTWHTVNSGAASWFEFARQIIDRAGVSASVTPVVSAEFPTPARRPPYSALDNAKLSCAIAPMRPWQEALDEYLIAKGHRNRA